MVRLLNGTLMRIFTLWQTVECDPHYLCAGALSAPVLLSRPVGAGAGRAPVHCYCCGACREAHQPPQTHAMHRV